MPKRLASGLLALCLACCAGTATSRPYTIDDMLRLEGYGEVTLQPHGSALIVEKLGPYASAPAFRYGYFSRRLTSHIFVRAIDGHGPLLPLFDQGRDAGYWAGGFSPSGRMLVVFRLDASTVRVGILDMASRAVRWLPDHPDLPIDHPDPVWIDDTHVLLAVTAAGRLPTIFDFSNRAQRDLPVLWARAAAGKVPSMTAIGSGHYLDVRARPPAGGLVDIDVRSGTEHRLFVGNVEDLALAADHTALIVVTATTDVQPSPDRPIGDDTTSQHHAIHWIDLASGDDRLPCARCDVLTASPAWSPQGHELLFVARSETTDWSSGQLYLTRNGRNARPLLPPGIRPAVQETHAGTVFVPAAWAGSTPVMLAQSPQSGTSTWYRLSPGPDLHAEALDAALPHLLAASPDDLLTTDGDRIVRTQTGGESHTLDGRLVQSGLAIGDPLRPGARKLLAGPTPAVTIRSTTGTIAEHGVMAARVTGPGLAVQVDDQLRAIDAGGRHAVVVRTDDHGVGRLLLLAPGHMEELDRINTGLADVDAAQATPLVSHGTGASEAHWLFLPPTRSAERRVPLVVIPYPGTVFGPATPPAQGPGKLHEVLSAQLLAAQGYAVLFPSIPLGRDDHDPVDRIMPAVDAAVDAAVATGQIDPDRIAVWGHSFGGYAALTLASRSRRYRAIIASSAVINLLADYGRMPAATKTMADTGIDLAGAFGWSEAGQGGLGAQPWQNPERFVHNSPYFGAPSITAPVLLIQGDIDFLGIHQSEQMFAALFRLDKDALLLRYWGEDHMPASPANIRDIYTRVIGFLAAAMPAKPGSETQDQARAQASSAR